MAMKMRIPHILFLCSILIFSCTKPHIEIKDKNPITFSVTDYDISVMDTKSAFLFEDEGDFQNKGESGTMGHGGYFMVTTFHSDSKASFFRDSVIVRYHDDVTEGVASWRTYYPGTDFPDGSDKIDYSDRGYMSIYWPSDNNKEIDFLAYMPLQRPENTGGLQRIKTKIDPNSHMKLTDHGAGRNPKFICTGLPTDKTGQDKAKDFLYAYTPGQSYTETEGQVNLEFQHAFAAVYIKIGWPSGGVTINSFSFDNIHNTGTFIVKPEDESYWSYSESNALTALTISDVNLRVPSDIQTGSTLGPYLVLPQDLISGQTSLQIVTTSDDQTIGTKSTIYYMDDGNADNGDERWEPGKKYIYTLALGSSADYVEVSVKVERWEKIGDGQEIEIK